MGLIDHLQPPVPEAPGAADAPPAPAAPVLDIGPATDAQVLGTLATMFGSDEACRRIELRRDGMPLGGITREAAIALVDDGLKGVGASDGLWLPGVADFTTSRWACPLAGCKRTLTTIVIGEPPHCPAHPAQAMEPLA